MGRRHPFPSSLGDLVAEDIEARCCHGPGDVYGEPVRLTGEEVAFLEDAYRIDPRTGRREFDIGAYVRRKGTRKSELGAWLVVVETTGPCRAYLDGGEAVARPPVDPSVICLATTEDQGDLVYGAFRSIVAASAHLAPLYDVGLEVTYLTEGPGKIELTQANNAAALDGARPTFEVGDELHLWTAKLRETFATVRRNLRKRHAAMPWLFAPTTPYAVGDDSVLESLHEAVGFRGTGRHKVGRLLVDWREASMHWDISDAVQLREGITEAGGDAHWSDTEGIAADWESGTVPEHEFRRYWLGQRFEAVRESWLPADAFEACRQPGLQLDVELPTWVSIDMALRHDTVAVVAVQRPDEGPLRAFAWTWDPDGDVVDIEDVEAKVKELHRACDVRDVAYDPAYFERSAQALADEGLPMLEFPQSPQRMVPACGVTYSAVCGGGIVHDFGAKETAQVIDATPRTAGEGWRLSKGKAKRKIDTAIALVIAVAEASHPEEVDVYDGPLVAFR